jgi:hypothetical protein
MTPSVAVEIDEVENSPWDEIFEKSTDITEVAGLEQRLRQIDLQVVFFIEMAIPLCLKLIKYANSNFRKEFILGVSSSW